MTSTIDALNSIINGQPLPAAQTRQPSIAKEELRSRLKVGTWMVEFVKVDGTPSVMECTLDPRLLPPGEAQDGGTKVTDNPTVLRVYALDREGWRSFKVLNVTNFYPKPENL